MLQPRLQQIYFEEEKFILSKYKKNVSLFFCIFLQDYIEDNIGTNRYLYTVSKILDSPFANSIPPIS